MPPIRVYYYAEGDWRPVREWLGALRALQPRACSKCLRRMADLKARGHELRRPHADSLGDGLFELRVRDGRVNYRILYCFHGPGRAVLLHALTKEGKVPEADIARASLRRRRLREDPERHAHEEENLS